MIEEENLIERANYINKIVTDKLKITSKYIGEVRAIGAMIGIEFVKDQNTKEPNAAFVQSVVTECFENGVLFMRAGDGNVIRLLPPLVITDEELTEAMDVIVNAIKKLES